MARARAADSGTNASGLPDTTARTRVSPAVMSRVASRAFSTDHWLPTRARAWLERVESAAFTRALVDAMKTVPSLAGREDITASRIASRAEELYAEESSSRRELGDVESTHVKTAARALATYETLRPFLGNDEATLEFVRARAGSEKTATTMNGGLVRGALMLRSRGNRARALAGMVANVTNDLAPGAWTRTDDDDGGGGASFETTTCAYHAFFEKRDVAFLTTTTCCSLDVEVWFGNVNEPTARVELAESKANGDARCRVRVRTTRG